MSDTLQEVLSTICNVTGKILIVTHERPDGDAVSSLSGLHNLLNDNGYKAEALFPDKVPDFYRDFMCPIVDGQLTASQINENYSLLINVDASTVKRVGLGGISFSDIIIPSVTLDHHPDNELFATINHINPKATASAQIVYRLATEASWQISKKSATLLMLGVITDSGCFRFDNTAPDALRSAAELLELGADHHKIIEKVYLSKPLNMVSFESEMFYRSMHQAFDGRFAWFVLDTTLMKQYSIDLKDTEQLIEMLRSIEGVEVAALIKPPSEDGAYKISLRSKNPALSVGKIARRLNGGGHEMAAGGTIYASSFHDAEQILLHNVEMEINGTQS